MIMFIASEVMFFVAWFWAFFDCQPVPQRDRAVCPRRLHRAVCGRRRASQVLESFHLPLYNTIILLLSSGTTVTWAHHALIHNDRKGLV